MLTPGQCQRLLELLQVVVGLCDHHADGVLDEREDGSSGVNGLPLILKDLLSSSKDACENI